MAEASGQRRLSGWPLAALILGVLALLLAGWTLWAIFRLPGQALRAGGEVVEELEDLAAAFNRGTVTRRFVSQTTEISGTTHLQVASLEETQVFTLEDAASTLWGAVELPTVEVRATVPVSFTYFLDLDGAWNFELRDGRVRVIAPSLRWNRPSIDVSNLEYEVTQGSLLRDEEEVLATLRRELMGRSAIRAQENTNLVRETARRQTEEFVTSWLMEHFDGAGGYPVEILFADEVPGGVPSKGSLEAGAVPQKATGPSASQEVP